MIKFLNDNVGLLTLVFSGVVTLSTVVYAILTAILVRETRKMRQAQTEPRIEVSVRTREEWVNLLEVHVQNIGMGPAFDISFNIKAEAGGEGAIALIEDFTRANFLNTGLKYLGPSQKVVSDITQMTNKFDQKIKSILVFVTEYKNAAGKIYKDIYRIDFKEFEGRSQLGRPYLYDISKHIETIKNDLHDLATGFKRMKVNTYNNADRENERKEWEERRSKGPEDRK